MKYSSKLTGILFALGAASIPCLLHAQASLDHSLVYMQDFDSVPGVATAGYHDWNDNSTIQGWYALHNAKAATQFRATNGNLVSLGTTPLRFFRKAGAVASFGVTSDADNKGAIGLQIANNSGATLTSLTISYVGRQWAWNTGAISSLRFAYSTDASSLLDGTWTGYAALDFTALYGSNTTNQGLDGLGSDIYVSGAYVTKVDGQAGGPGAENFVAITATIEGVSIAPGQTVWLRWADDFSGTGMGQGLSIDNFRISATAIPEASNSILMGAVVVFCAVCFVRRARNRSH